MRRRMGLALVTSMLTGTPLAAQLTVPVTTVLGTNVFSGPTFTVPTALSSTDVLSLTVSGIVSLQGTAYGTNAAGVVVVPGSTGTGGTSTFTNAFGTFNFGSLLIGNPTIGFRQLFAANPANGLGSAAPPTTLTLTSVPLSTIFGGGLAAGTVLELRIADINTGDNAGAFTLSQTATVVPEPSTIVLLGTGVLLLAATRRRTRRPA